mmetsp:Transcript_50771/g.93864  ORF Transcript_50771/g.93864 Transcript_50771/m.93864 type:complete len:247 (-) Transcript_50771:2093-2833(-)
MINTSIKIWAASYWSQGSHCGVRNCPDTLGSSSQGCHSKLACCCTIDRCATYRQLDGRHGLRDLGPDKLDQHLGTLCCNSQACHHRSPSVHTFDTYAVGPSQCPCSTAQPDGVEHTTEHKSGDTSWSSTHQVSYSRSPLYHTLCTLACHHQPLEASSCLHHQEKAKSSPNLLHLALVDRASSPPLQQVQEVRMASCGYQGQLAVAALVHANFVGPSRLPPERPAARSALAHHLLHFRPPEICHKSL